MTFGCHYSIPTLCYFDTWHHKRMALYRHILSIWLNQQQIIKHKAGGWRKNSPSILPFYLLYCWSPHATEVFPLQTAGKYLMGALIQNRCRRMEGGEGRPICLESIWAKRVPNKQIRLSLITISQTGGAA